MDEAQEKEYQQFLAEQTVKEGEAEDFLTQHLIKKDVPSIEQLLKDITPEGLKDQFKDQVTAIRDYIEAHQGVLSGELDRNTDFLYQCWAATRGLSQHPLSDFALSLNNFESFRVNFLPNITASNQADLIDNTDGFIRHRVHDKRFFIIRPEQYLIQEKMGIYGYHGQWLALAEKYRFNGFVYLDKDLIPEILKYLTDGSREADLFHATGSAALQGIGQHKAILSARETLRRGEEVKTGEYVTYIGHHGKSVSGGAEGLSTVLTAQQVSSGYARTRWFNEFHVVFGLSSQKQTHFLEKKRGFKNVKFRQSWQGGIGVGPEVSLANVTEMYCYFKSIPELQAWSDQHCPGVKIIPLEIPELMQTLELKTEYKDHRNSVDFWRDLAAKNPVRL